MSPPPITPEHMTRALQRWQALLDEHGGDPDDQAHGAFFHGYMGVTEETEETVLRSVAGQDPDDRAVFMAGFAVGVLARIEAEAEERGTGRA